MLISKEKIFELAPYTVKEENFTWSVPVSYTEIIGYNILKNKDIIFKVKNKQVASEICGFLNGAYRESTLDAIRVIENNQTLEINPTVYQFDKNNILFKDDIIYTRSKLTTPQVIELVNKLNKVYRQQYISYFVESNPVSETFTI